jgi:hypothetical protein
MAIIHLHMLQVIHRVQYLIGHITNNNGAFKLMRICIKAIQLEVGTFEPFLFLPYSLHGPTLIPRSWINKIWSLNKLFNGTICQCTTRTVQDPVAPTPLYVYSYHA